MVETRRYKAALFTELGLAQPSQKSNRFWDEQLVMLLSRLHARLKGSPFGTLVGRDQSEAGKPPLPGTNWKNPEGSGSGADTLQGPCTPLWEPFRRANRITSSQSRSQGKS